MQNEAVYNEHMKRNLLSIFFVACATSAMAQSATSIGSVTIIRPGKAPVTAPPARQHASPAPQSKPSVTTPQPRSTTAPTQGNAVQHQAVPMAAPADLQQGMRRLEGRVVAGENLRLPAGSRISVEIEERNAAGERAARHLQIGFASSSLPSSYHMTYNPARFRSGGKYVVQAVVSDASGKVLYRSAGVPLPANRAAKLDLTVR